jgi:hypothetical protein
MAAIIILLHESPRRSQRSEHARRPSPKGTTLDWHDCGPRDVNCGSCATTVPSSTRAPRSNVSLQATSPSAVEEQRSSRLAAKPITGFHTLLASIRRKPNDPQSRRPKHQRAHSTSSTANISSLDVGEQPPSSVQAAQQPSSGKPEVNPDLSALVPDYLDDPPPYSSPIRERQEVIDWKAHFDKTPILTRMVSPHSFPAIEDGMSLATLSEGAWDRVAGRLSR